jgi:peptide/nickel transport system permease protein
MDVLPGDAAIAILGPESPPATVEALRKRLNLDLPIYERYLRWLVRSFTGDLGTSLSMKEPVTVLAAKRLPITLILAIFSMLVASAIGIPAGIVSAVKRDSKTDLAVSIGSFVGVSIPGFWLGMIMILVLSVWLGVLPSAGFVYPWDDLVEFLKRIIMPSVMLGTILAAFLARMTRSCMLEVMLQDYITTARAKGLTERVVVYKHALKNAMIPVTTVMGFQFGSLIGGTIIAEQVFSIGGFGSMFYQAILFRDYVLVQGCGLIVVVIFVIINLVVDLTYMYLDPRVRYD